MLNHLNLLRDHCAAHAAGVTLRRALPLVEVASSDLPQCLEPPPWRRGRWRGPRELGGFAAG
eukprot:12834634-Alexandrium_andersonii.AAC.1